MAPEFVTLVNTVVVPVGLIAIMFSMGLSLTFADFKEVTHNPRAVAVGLGGQLLLLPPLGVAIAWLFALPPEMAAGLFILAICPGGVTSNAVTFAARANVALGLVLTALSSLVTVFTVPWLMQWGIDHYLSGGEVPALSVLDTMRQLAVMTIVPVAAGMILRRLSGRLAERLVPYLRPAAAVVLVAVIGFSVVASLDLLVANLLRSGPAAYALNAAGVAVGVLLGALFNVNTRDRLTIGIEVGVQNATMATFLTLSILNDLALAITPTLYGCIMVLNAGLLVRWFRRRKNADEGGAKVLPSLPQG